MKIMSVAATLFFITFSGNVFSQESHFLSRFSLKLDSGLNFSGDDFNSAGALSIGIEPTFQVNDNFTIGLKYDLGLIGFGENHRGTSEIYPPHKRPRLYYHENEMKRISPVGFTAYYHFRLFRAKLFAGYGVFYFRKGHILYHIKDFESNLISTSQSRIIDKIDESFCIGVNGEKVYWAVVFNRPDTKENYPGLDPYTSLRCGVKLFKDETLKRKELPQLKGLPFVMVEGGIQYLIPFGKLGQAAVANFYFEPKIAFTHRLSLGFRISTKEPLEIGLDKDYDRYKFVNFNGKEKIYWFQLNQMKLTQNKLITGDYYIPEKTGWWIVGIALGFYSKKGVGKFSGLDDEGNPKELPAYPAEKNIGGAVRAGYKTGIFRAHIDLNITGKNIPNYFGFQLGIEPGFGSKWKKLKCKMLLKKPN